MPASVRPASSVAASSAAAHKRRGDGHDRQSDGERARVPDALRPAAGRQAEHGADQGDDRHRRAGAGQRQAEVVLQLGHQRRHDAELSRRQHADGVEQGDARPGGGHGGDVRDGEAIAYE